MVEAAVFPSVTNMNEIGTGAGPEVLTGDALLLSMRMITDALDDRNIPYSEGNISAVPHLKGVRLYDGYTQVSDPDYLYYLPAGMAASFPVDTLSYITTEDLDGAAPHIIRVIQEPMSLFNLLLVVFQRYHAFETRINDIIAGGGTLDDLCLVGYDFFHNPMYIHDRYFSIISMPCWVQGMLQFEYNEQTGRYNIPLALIEDFKFNSSYHDTLLKKEASIWGTDQYPYGMRSMYVNLWDGDVYRGRLLINEVKTPFTRGQFAAAEFLGRKITAFIRLHSETGSFHQKSHENTIRSLLTQGTANASDVTAFLTSVSWRDNDTFVCLRIQSQTPDTGITSDSILRSRLQAELPHTVSFFHEEGICLLTNVSKNHLRIGDISHILSPIARDCLLYVGISTPVKDLYALHYAFLQAEAALDITARKKDMHWVLSFDNCALDYMGNHINSELPDLYLVSSPLLYLQAWDHEHGTEYLMTLRVYLEEEQSIPRSSARLIIHRTTLLYRLSKIKALVSIDLGDPDTRLHLLISFRLLERSMKTPETPDIHN